LKYPEKMVNIVEIKRGWPLDVLILMIIRKQPCTASNTKKLKAIRQAPERNPQKGKSHRKKLPRNQAAEYFQRYPMHINQKTVEKAEYVVVEYDSTTSIFPHK
jgi:hypothetical protein